VTLSRSNLLKAFVESDFLEDALHNWVDPDCPLSGCLVGLWLRHFIELPDSCHESLGEVTGAPEGDVVSYLVRLILAQRLHALAREIGWASQISPFAGSQVEQILLRMIAEVSYHKGHLPSQLRVAQQLRTLQRTQVMLYGMGGHRDHLYHAIHVASLGVLLNDARVLDQGDRPLLEGDVLGDWLLTALCHDLGHAATQDLDVPSLAGATAHLTDYDAVAKDVGQKRREYLAQVNRKAKEKVGFQTDLGERFDHGIISYDYVCNLIEGLTPKELRRAGRERFRSALSAIAKHHLHGEPISFRQEPLAALLVFCDELQDWGRPRWDSDAFASKVLGLLHFGQDRPHEPSVICNRIRISAGKEAGAAHRCTIVLEYADPMKQQYDPWAMVVCKLAALQRLSEMPPVRLVLKLPRSRDWQNLIVSDALYSYRGVMRKFAVQYDHPILREEVLWPRLTGKPRVHWVTAEDDQEILTDLQDVKIEHEAVVIDLEGVSQFQPVLGSVTAFFSEFEEFMKRLFAAQGRAFPGLQRGG